MVQDVKTVLITGCSDGSLGAALAKAFHSKGYYVFASARDMTKMGSLQGAGIQCLELDVLSQDSIYSCKAKIAEQTSGTLDILVNNAGGGHYMPFMHLDLQKARDLFEINVWSHLAVTQAFLPLLMNGASPKADGRKAMIVNNTSISSVLKTPFHSAYGASKAAMAAFNDAQRVELEPFGVRVVDLKTGSTESNFSDNRTNETALPNDSPYQPIRDEVMAVISGDKTEAYAEDQTVWAKNVVSDLLATNPPAQIWRGGAAGTVRLTDSLKSIVPAGMDDSSFRELGGLNKLEKILKE